MTDEQHTNLPLWLPAGSVRAIVLLMMTLALIASLWLPTTGPAIKVIETGFAVVLGYYFGKRE